MLLSNKYKLIFDFIWHLIFFLQLMHADIQKRLPSSGCENKMYAYGVLLHPSYRSAILSDFKLTQQTVDAFVQENEVLVEGSGANLDDAIAMDEDDLDDEEAFLRAYSQNARRSSDDQATSESILPPQTPLQTELSKYLARSEHSNPPNNVDILGWWKEHQKTFPLLAKCAKKYLAVQATSCSSERTFSTGGQTVTWSRTKLDPTNVHMLVYCKDNLPIVNIQKLRLEDNEEKDLEEECEAENETGTDSDDE